MKRTITIRVNPSPHELASALADMSDHEQAEFFNALYNEFKPCGGNWPLQLQYISDSKELQPEGRTMMRMIGDYADNQ